MGKLNERQRRFVSEYVREPNGAQAAIRAGYSPARASPTAARLVADGKIASAIARGQQRVAERNEISADAIVQELLHNAESARADGDWGASTRAYELVGRHIGMWPRQAPQVNVDARSVSVELASLSTDELRALIRGVVAQGAALPEASDGGVR